MAQHNNQEETENQVSKNLKIEKELVFVVEGKDDESLFLELKRNYDSEDRIQIIKMNGKDNLKSVIISISKDPNRRQISKIGFVLDADNAFNKELNTLRQRISQHFGIVSPVLPGMFTRAEGDNITIGGSDTEIGVYIFPNNRDNGILEDLCLQAISDDPATECIEHFTNCLAELESDKKPKNMKKAKMRAFCASRVENTEYIGRAFQKKYLDVNHPVFEEFKNFFLYILNNP